MDPQRLIPGDVTLIENIVNYLKAKGIFDQFRHECLADVDTKSSCQNLSQRVDGYTSKFLANETWHPDLNKNELRNKLRRNIDESGMLTVGADHVVEQVINPKIHQFFLPKIIEVVHQYIKEQNDLFNKKTGTYPLSNESTFTSDKVMNETTDSKAKASISDPIADILSFSYSKSKPAIATNAHVKTENVQQKQVDLKSEKKKEEKPPIPEKSNPDAPSEATTTLVSTEMKTQVDKEKEKCKKEELEISQDIIKKAVKEESKAEKKKVDDAKVQVSEIETSVDENKSNTPTPSKPLAPGKKDHDKNKQKIKASNVQKSTNSSNETKKPKKEPSDKSSEKLSKVKPPKSPKESPSPVKSVSLVKSASKEEKVGEGSKAKSSDSNSSKTSDSSLKKVSKSSFNKNNSSSKYKGPSDKSDKPKISKLTEKSDQLHQDSSSSEKGAKSIHYSSSYDSSQGSDQEKSSSSSSKKEKQKHFSKSAKKEKSESTDKDDKTSSDKKKVKDVDESMTKKPKNEKNSKLEKLREVTVGEAAKISSRSNSFGSTSSIGSSSNTSKDNLMATSDEMSESSVKDKKKKPVKEKDSCHNPDIILPPPPPPPPPSSSLTSEATSSAEMSSMDDTTESSCDSETSSSREMSEGPPSDSELELKDIELSTLNENVLNASTDSRNSVIEKIFLSSSSSEFEGFDSSPEKIKKEESEFQDLQDSDVSSVHTSDLSNFNDELSDEEFSINESGVKKRLTLKEAQELLQKKALFKKRNKKSSMEEDKSDSDPASPQNKNRTQSASSFLSSLENSPLKRDGSDSDVSVSSVHTSDLSSFNDELSDDGLFFNESPSGKKKRLTLKEAEELIRRKVVPDKDKESPSENKSKATPTVLNESSTQKSSPLSSDEESSPIEPKRSLRRERKLNPRYASSEYTSIFNCKKETFITKQSSPVKNSSVNSSQNVERRIRKKESLSEKNKSLDKSSVEALEDVVHLDKTNHAEEVENILHNSKISCDNKESSSSIDIIGSKDLKSAVDKEKIFEINNKPTDDSDADHLKMHVKLKVQNNSKLNMNSHSLKRKSSATESTLVKRMRSSVDSSSSELVPNENKPFNCDKQDLVEDKKLRDGKLKGSDLTGGIKKDLFSKQRSNNNGDVFGQKDNFPRNSHGRTANNSEKKSSESDTSKELSAL